MKPSSHASTSVADNCGADGAATAALGVAAGCCAHEGAASANKKAAISVAKRMASPKTRRPWRAAWTARIMTLSYRK
jgi:hypothetical protein